MRHDSSIPQGSLCTHVKTCKPSAKLAAVFDTTSDLAPSSPSTRMTNLADRAATKTYTFVSFDQSDEGILVQRVGRGSGSGSEIWEAG